MKQGYFLVAILISNITYADTTNLKSLNTYECTIADNNNSVVSSIHVYAKSADIAVAIFKERLDRIQLKLSSQDDIICTQKN